MGRLFGREGFRPGKIALQVVALQLLFYGAASAALVVLFLLVGTPLQARFLFSWPDITFSTAEGWAGVIAATVASFVVSFAFPIVVERAKKVVDFAATLYSLHVAVSSAYSGSFPTAWDWWVVLVAALVLTSFLGEKWCLETEMQDIAVEDILHARRGANGGASGSSSTASAAPSAATASAATAAAAGNPSSSGPTASAPGAPRAAAVVVTIDVDDPESEVVARRLLPSLFRGLSSTPATSALPSSSSSSSSSSSPSSSTSNNHNTQHHLALGIGSDPSAVPNGGSLSVSAASSPTLSPFGTASGAALGRAPVHRGPLGSLRAETPADGGEGAVRHTRRGSGATLPPSLSIFSPTSLAASAAHAGTPMLVTTSMSATPTATTITSPATSTGVFARSSSPSGAELDTAPLLQRRSTTASETAASSSLTGSGSASTATTSTSPHTQLGLSPRFGSSTHGTRGTPPPTGGTGASNASLEMTSPSKIFPRAQSRLARVLDGERPAKRESGEAGLGGLAGAGGGGGVGVGGAVPSFSAIFRSVSSMLGAVGPTAGGSVGGGASGAGSGVGSGAGRRDEAGKKDEAGSGGGVGDSAGGAKPRRD